MTYQEIDRMFFELLRLKVVAIGYLPDVVAFAANPTGYATAKDTLRAAKPEKQLIEIFGTSNSEDKDDKIMSRIVVRRIKRGGGSIGAAGVTYMDEVRDDDHNLVSFTKMQYPDKAIDLTYEIRIVADDIRMERLMNGVVDECLGEMRYLKTCGEDGLFTQESVFVEYMGESSINLKSYIENIRMYTVRDVFVQPFKTVRGNIVPMTTVHFFLYSQNQDKILAEGVEPDVEVDVNPE